MSVVSIASVQVGLLRTLGTAGAEDPMDRPWTTGFFKESVTGAVWVGATNLAGDEQADLRVHGGPDKAVLAYAAAHYPEWARELGFELPPGGFGENLTVEGEPERTVCIGDVYRVGSALLQVSQPRGPCWKIARRWRIRDLSARVQRTGRTGWYLRVLCEGEIEAGMPCELVERPGSQWTVALANELRYRPVGREAAAAELAECPWLAASWAEGLRHRLSSSPSDQAARLIGPNQ